jgi:transcriptional regulator with XRE-family HTH domain
MARRRASAKTAGAQPVGAVVARRIREAREARKPKWTQQDLARALVELGSPMDRTTVAKIEKGQRPVRVEELVAIAAALDVAPVYLLVPPRGEGTIALTPKLTVDVAKARGWARGDHALDPRSNMDAYADQAPAVTEAEIEKIVRRILLEERGRDA